MTEQVTDTPTTRPGPFALLAAYVAAAVRPARRRRRTRAVVVDPGYTGRHRQPEPEPDTES
jgi:hypothetical protein